ncbi:MAG TPA: hypothetical protein DCL81_19715, partial [Algoriphagus sp.]|nr:hypothetical protein [Algoriphagus sp.]
MLNFFKYTLLLFCFISIHAFGQVEDKVYKDHIQSVRIFPVGAAFDSQLDASVISMSDSRPLML